MKFSVCLSTGFEGVMYPVPFAGPEDFIAQGKLCERLGYDSVWGNDHVTTQDYVRDLFPGKPPNFYEPMMVLAAIGAVTTRLKLGTALTVLPMRDPVYLAKQAITLDQMSNGRFIMAVGLGAYREEFLAWGGSRVEKARRGDMMDEGLEALQLLFNEARCSYEGKYYTFKDLEMFPKSRAQPFPLYVGGHNMEALERAARYGQGWLPGWRPLKEMEERIATLKARALEVGRNPGDIDRTAILGDCRQDPRGRGKALYGKRAGRAPGVAFLHRPRSQPSGRCQSGRVARRDSRENRQVACYWRRSLQRPDVPRELGGRDERTGRVVCHRCDGQGGCEVMSVEVTMHISPGPCMDCKVAPEAYSAIGGQDGFLPGAAVAVRKE
jgi:probable F420-dependent oxidoreductase